MSSQLVLTLLENHILIKSLILIVFCIQLSHSAPTTSRGRSGVRSDEDAERYLQTYGYTDESGDSYSNSMLKFQTFAGITQTGFLDDETIRMMNSPRCGNVDSFGLSGDDKRRKRYLLQGSEWEPECIHLTYRISSYPTGSDLTNEQVDCVIAEAFKMWSEVAPLTFEAKKWDRCDIEILFGKYEHGDGYPFDGPGHVLAHAFFPQYGGDAHFDDSEYWTICSYDGFNLKYVAVHEFGHSLGLLHSDIPTSVMYPFIQEYDPDFKLHEDDILGIQEIYGTKQTCCGCGSGCCCGTRT